MSAIRALFVSFVLLLASASVASQTLYSVTSQDDLLRIVDPLTAATVDQVQMTVADAVVDRATGLATDPVSQELYVVLRLDGVSGSTLARVDPATGVATPIGALGESFAGIAFTCDALFGVTGDGSTTPETLFRIDTQTGDLTLVAPLGRGDDGEALGFNPVDGYLYHASGHTGAFDPKTGDGVIFERVSPDDGSTIDIPLDPLSPLLDEEAQALTWFPPFNAFLWKQNHSTGPLFLVAPEGTAILIGDMDHQAKGLAFVPTFRCSSGIFQDGFEDAP